MYDRIQELAGKANGRAWGFGGVSGVEIVQLSTYEGESRGFYDWHPVRIPLARCCTPPCAPSVLPQHSVDQIDLIPPARMRTILKQRAH